MKFAFTPNLGARANPTATLADVRMHLLNGNPARALFDVEQYYAACEIQRYIDTALSAREDWGQRCGK